MNVKAPKSYRLQLLIVALFVSIIIATVGVLFFKHQQKAIRTEKFNDLKAIADLKTNQLVQWQKERLSEASFFSKNEPLVRGVLKLMNGDKSSNGYIYASLSHIKSNNRYENIFVLNQRGDIVFKLDSSFEKVEPLTLLKSLHAFSSRQIVFTDFYHCSIHNSIHFDIIAPILNLKGEVFATLVFRVNPDDYLFPLIQDWPTPSKSAETLLVMKEGDSVVFINTLRHIGHPPLTLRIPLSMVEVPAVSAIHGRVGLYEGIDYRGKKVLSVISAVPDSPWFMIAKVDRAEILKDLFFQLWLIVAITVLLIFFTGAVIVWYYHYRQKNIFKFLLQSEEELHQSQEEFRATLYSIGDGVITTDKKGFVKQMNSVAEKLTGWKENEARTKKLEDVFSIVNEETRDKVENPVNKVLKEGLIVGLANHTLLISKDGTEIPIADSGAPIRNQKNEITGVVLVFSDQSEERKQQNELKESEEKYKSLFNSIRDTILVTNNQRIINQCNPAFFDLFGYTSDEIIGKETSFIYKDLNEFMEMGKKIKENMDNPNFILPISYRKKNGEIFLGETNVFYLKNHQGEILGFIGMIRDITERNKAEKALKKIEWMLTREPAPLEVDSSVNIIKDQSYGDLTTLNNNGLIKNSIEKSILHGIVNEYMTLLETSSAIYEKNGDYAYGIFSSGWCKLMDQASRNLCNTEDNAEALASGKWLCHESCWKDCSLKAISTKKTADIECNGGINLYAVPIFANGEVIGVINFGYGDPPNDEIKLHKLAKDYKLDIQELIIESNSYSSRPKFIIDIARKRIAESAKLIGAMVERKIAENAMRESENQFRQLVDNAPQGIFVQTDKRFAYVNPVAIKLFGAKNESELLNQLVLERFHPDYRESVNTRIHKLNVELTEVPPVEEVCLKMDGSTFDAEVSAVPINYQSKNGALVFFHDITERKQENIELIELKNELENMVAEKTKELKQRIAELERFHEATIERELRIKELREEIKRLKREA